jgi:hypothetical protein
MADDVRAALLIARNALAEVVEFQWPAHSDREGNVIACADRALRQIVAHLERFRGVDARQEDNSAEERRMRLTLEPADAAV